MATVTTDLEFKFDKSQLEALISHSQNRIGISVCSIPENGSSGPMEFYLCALAYDAQRNPPTEIRPILGCTFPPACDEAKDLFQINSQALDSAPKFFADISLLNAELPKNAHIPGSKGHKEVSAFLRAELNLAGNLVTFVTFQMKDASGSPVGTPVRADN